jgi:tetratricopeptide (TPR) repeat protein
MLMASDFTGAEELYQKILNQVPNNAGALVGLAMVYNQTGKSREALELLQKVWHAIETADQASQQSIKISTKAEILAQIGLALHQLHYLDQALIVYREANKLVPSEELNIRINHLLNIHQNIQPIDQLLNQAKQFKAENQYEQAFSSYQAALRLNPDNDKVLHELGDLYRQTGDTQSALPLIQQAIIMQPSVAEYQNTLGMLFQQRGEHEKALLFHRRAVAIDDKFAAAYCNVGVALKNLNRLDEAIQAYQKAIEINPKLPEPFNNLGNLQRIQGDIKAAEKNIKQALKLRPVYPDAELNLKALNTMINASKPKIKRTPKTNQITGSKKEPKKQK